MKVSFDWDGTLEIMHVQEYAKELIERGIEVWIVTSRFSDDEKFRSWASVEDVRLVMERNRLKMCIDEKVIGYISNKSTFNPETKLYE